MPGKIGVIGLGIMGSAMSASLVVAGFSVRGYDVLARRRAELKKALAEFKERFTAGAAAARDRQRTVGDVTGALGRGDVMLEGERVHT